MAEKLLVDIEQGRVLEAPQRVEAGRQFLESHPFIARCFMPEEGRLVDLYFVGPDAHRRVAARSQGTGEGGLDAIEYIVTLFDGDSEHGTVVLEKR